MKTEVLKKYGDIIDMPHHQSASRQRMSLYDRAAQFSPFAALTGHADAIKETARYTDEKIEIDEEREKTLNERFAILLNEFNSYPEINITYFVPDEKKSGGKYVTETCFIKKFNPYDRVVETSLGAKIHLDNVFDIDGKLFERT